MLFALLTLLQFHRDFRNNTNDIILTSTDPIHHQVHKTLALICAAIVTSLLISLFALPYGMVNTGSYFQPATFLTAWYLIFLAALVFAVLLTSGFYMLTGHWGATSVIMAGLILFSKLLESTHVNPEYLLYWVQTTAGNFSDVVTNRFQIDMLLWNRLFCLLVSLSIWTLGLCSLRRCSLGLFSSFRINCRRLWIPVFLITTITLSGVSYACEPIFDDSKPIDYSGMIKTDTGEAVITVVADTPEFGNPELMLTEKVFNLDVSTKKRTLSGTAEYRLVNGSGKAQTLPVQTNTGINIDSVAINGVEGKAIRGETGENSTANWRIELPAAYEYVIRICYSGRMLNNNTSDQRATYGISDGYVWLPADGIAPHLDITVSDECSFYGNLFTGRKTGAVFPAWEYDQRRDKERKDSMALHGKSRRHGNKSVRSRVYD